jgi:hypothetical protein
MKRITPLVCLAALSMLLTLSVEGQKTGDLQTGGPPTLPTYWDVDHFRCYFVPPTVLSVDVLLQDEFDGATQEVINQLTSYRFCNPVEKKIGDTVTPIVSVDHHLTMFLINPQPVIRRTVQVNNQFGVQTFTTLDAKILAAPTGKGISPAPPPLPSTSLDHYKCYAIEHTTTNVPVPPWMLLTDQFLAENVERIQAVWYCNPVKKIHGTSVVNIRFPQERLVCYTTTPSNFLGIAINTLSQFGALSYAAGQPDLLCVASITVSWIVPVPDPVIPPGAAALHPPKQKKTASARR